MKFDKRHLVVLLLASSAIGCARSSPPPAFCAVALPIYVAEEDQFTDKTADQILGLPQDHRPDKGVAFNQIPA